MVASHTTQPPAGGSQYDNTIYCEAVFEPKDIYFEGSDDDNYNTPATRKQRLEAAGQRYLDGKVPLLLTATLRGPFDKESGWENPWQSKKSISKKRVSASRRPSQPLRALRQQECGNRKPSSITKHHEDERPVEIDCHLPSPESLKQVAISDSHPYLEKDELASVQKWRKGIAPTDESPSPIKSRKRNAVESSWLKRVGSNKRRRLDRMEEGHANTPSGSCRSTPEAKPSNCRRLQGGQLSPSKDLEGFDMEIDHNHGASSAVSPTPAPGNNYSPTSERMRRYSGFENIRNINPCHDELDRDEAAAATLSSPVSQQGHASKSSQIVGSAMDVEVKQLPEVNRLTSRDPHQGSSSPLSTLATSISSLSNREETVDEDSSGLSVMSENGNDQKIHPSFCQPEGANIVSQSDHMRTALSGNPESSNIESTGRPHPGVSAPSPPIGSQLSSESLGPIVGGSEPQGTGSVSNNGTQDPTDFTTPLAPSPLPVNTETGEINTPGPNTSQTGDFTNESSNSSQAASLGGFLLKSVFQHCASPFRRLSLLSDHAKLKSAEANTSERADDSDPAEGSSHLKLDCKEAVQCHGAAEGIVACGNGISVDGEYEPPLAGCPPISPPTVQPETSQAAIGEWKTDILNNSLDTSFSQVHELQPGIYIPRKAVIPTEDQSPWIQEEGVYSLQAAQTESDIHSPLEKTSIPPNQRSFADDTDIFAEQKHGPTSIQEPQFAVSSFATFMTPSPTQPRRKVNRLIWRDSQSGLAMDQAILQNPWVSSTSRKRVTWAPLPHEEENDLGMAPPASGRQRPASPPPITPLPELPNLDANGKFKAHFTAMAGRKLAASQYPIGQASQEIWHPPSHHMAEAPIPVDKAESRISTKEPHCDQSGTTHSGAKPEDSLDPMDIVEDMLNEMGDFLQTWDVDAELDEARKIDGLPGGSLGAHRGLSEVLP